MNGGCREFETGVMAVLLSPVAVRDCISRQLRRETRELRLLYTRKRNPKLKINF